MTDLKIDVHTHLPKYRSRSESDEENEKREKDYRRLMRIGRPEGLLPSIDVDLTSWDGHYKAMEAVDQAIVFGIATPSDETNVNDDVAEYASQHPNKIIGFMSVDPNDSKCVEEMRRATDLGLKGLKLGPIYQNFHPHSEKAARILRQADRLGLPVMFHQATAPANDQLLDVVDPLLLEKLAVSYPDLKIIYAHMGHPWWRETVVTIRRHPNMFADISAMFYKPWDYYNALRFAYEWGQMDKLLLGSDFPIATPKETIERTLEINEMLSGTRLPTIPQDDIEAIVNRNALGLLGIHP